MYKHFKRHVLTIHGSKLIDFSPTGIGKELVYNINMTGVDQFKMSKNEEGIWKIIDNELPIWYKGFDRELSDIIEDQVDNHITEEALIERGFVLNDPSKKYFRLDTSTYTIAIRFSDGEWLNFIRPWEETPVTILYNMHDVERIIENAPNK